MTTNYPKVGPIGNSYYYRLGDHLSEAYANFPSAWAASREQQTLRDGTLIPFSRNGGDNGQKDQVSPRTSR